MRKKIAFLCCAGLLTAGFAKAQVSLNLTGGLTIASINARSGGQKVNTDAFTSYHVGALIDARLDKNWVFEPGLLFVRKGANAYFANETVKVKDRLSFLEIPLVFLYRTPAGPGHFYIGMGPYVGFTLSGKRTSVTHTGNTTITTESSLNIGGSSNDDYTSTDLGLTFKAAYKWRNGLALGAGYDLGLKNMTPHGDGDNYSHMRSGNIFVSFPIAGR